MATNSSEHLGLHLWEPTDQVLRTEFNQNWQKIDTAVAEAFGPDNRPYVSGSFTVTSDTTGGGGGAHPGLPAPPHPADRGRYGRPQIGHHGDGPPIALHQHRTHALLYLYTQREPDPIRQQLIERISDRGPQYQKALRRCIRRRKVIMIRAAHTCRSLGTPGQPGEAKYGATGQTQQRGLRRERRRKGAGVVFITRWKRSQADFATTKCAAAGCNLPVGNGDAFSDGPTAALYFFRKQGMILALILSER